MRPSTLHLATVIGFSLPMAIPASSYALGFGPDENIHRIQKIEGTDHYLCHKTTIYFFGLGVHMSDDGYVLREGFDFDQYIPLTDDRISELQAEGLLPDPLPEYSIPLIEYAFGYSLWILIALLILSSVARAAIRRAFGGDRARRLLANPIYQEALKIALNADDDGLNRAVDYLHENGVSLKRAHEDMQILLPRGESYSI